MKNDFAINKLYTTYVYGYRLTIAVFIVTENHIGYMIFNGVEMERHMAKKMYDDAGCAYIETSKGLIFANDAVVKN